MGGIPEKQRITEFPSGNSNGKKLTITGEFCMSWSYEDIVMSFKSSLIKKLSELGYTITYNVIPVKSAGDYYIYLGDENDKNKKLIFSNNFNLHKNSGAILGYEIDKNNVNKVIEIIEKENK